MITNEVQRRIHDGDQEAFKLIYAQYAREVYVRAMRELNDKEAARAVVKQTFLNLLGEIMRRDEDIDVASRVDSYAYNELLIRRIIADGGTACPDDASTIPAERDTAVAHAPVSESPAAQPAQTSAAQPAPAPAAFQQAPQTPADEPAAMTEEDDLPPLIRTRAYMRMDGKAEPTAPQADAHAKKRANPGVTVIAILLALLLLWILAGIAMDVSLLPRIDLGYRWFNEHIFRLFNA